MKLRDKKSQQECHSPGFNVHSLNEIIVQAESFGADSDYIHNYEVWLESKGEWKDLAQAFRDHDVITDNYNSYFFEPSNDEDRKRGFTL